MCIDLKSFFAACECKDRNLNIFTTPLVVGDSKRGGGSIILAITPYLKGLGVNSRCRLRDIPKEYNVIVAKPRMKYYLDTSMQIVDLYLTMFSSEDIFVYSIDEVFIDLGPYLALYKMSADKLARIVQKKLFTTMGLYASVGVGENMVMAKFAMDIEAKDNKSLFAMWTKEDVANKLWKVKDMKDLWGINVGLERRLNNIGISSIYQLANTDINILKKYLGKAGVHLHTIANGIDDTVISKDINYRIPKSIGKSQILYRDMDSHNAYLLLREMLEEIMMKVKVRKFVLRKIFIYVGYSMSASEKRIAKSITLDQPTDDIKVLLKYINDVLDVQLQPSLIRRVGISVADFSNKEHIQLSLFDDYEKNDRISDVLTDVKGKYGKSSLLYATSLLDDSTVKYRNKLIGGHNGSYEE